MSLEEEVLTRGNYYIPFGLCVDDSGTVYVADGGNRSVQVF